MSQPLQIGWAKFDREIPGATDGDGFARAEDGVDIRIDYARRELYVQAVGGRREAMALSRVLRYERPDDFKDRVLSAVKEKGATHDSVARKFNLSLGTLKTWTTRR